MSGESNRRRRVLLAGLKLAIVVAVGWGVSRTVRTGIVGLSDAAFTFSPRWLVLAGVSYLAGLAPCAWYWRRVLAELGVQRSTAVVWRAYFIGHLGKYVPGKALVVVLRTALLGPSRAETAPVAAAVFFETLTMMAVGGLVAGGVLAVIVRGSPWLMALALALMVASAVPTIPAVFLRILDAVERRFGRAGQYAVLVKLRLGLVLQGWLAIGCGWLLIGFSLWATARGLGISGSGAAAELPLCVATAALAVVAGFLSLVPGGVMVRESIVLELLQPEYGAAAALVTAIAVRLVWLVAEVAISTILYFLGGAPVDAAESAS